MGRSDQLPKVIVQSNGLTQVRYNIAPFTEDRGGKTVSGYSYNYVEIGGELTKANLISAIIKENYSINDELALINNEIKNPGTAEYAVYCTLRSGIKSITTEIISSMGN